MVFVCTYVGKHACMHVCIPNACVVSVVCLVCLCVYMLACMYERMYVSM